MYMRAARMQARRWRASLSSGRSSPTDLDPVVLAVPARAGAVGVHRSEPGPVLIILKGIVVLVIDDLFVHTVGRGRKEAFIVGRGRVTTSIFPPGKRRGTGMDDVCARMSCRQTRRGVRRTQAVRASSPWPPALSSSSSSSNSTATPPSSSPASPPACSPSTTTTKSVMCLPMPCRAQGMEPDAESVSVGGGKGGEHARLIAREGAQRRGPAAHHQGGEMLAGDAPEKLLNLALALRVCLLVVLQDGKHLVGGSAKDVLQHASSQQRVIAPAERAYSMPQSSVPRMCPNFAAPAKQEARTSILPTPAAGPRTAPESVKEESHKQPAFRVSWACKVPRFPTITRPSPHAAANTTTLPSDEQRDATARL